MVGDNDPVLHGDSRSAPPWRRSAPGAVTARVTLPSVVLEVVRFRALIKNLVFKDLKLKYRDSVLGVVWSLLNPLLMLLVYTLAFKFILRVPMENYAFFLLAGLLPWNFFASSLTASTQAIVRDAGLIRKVYFPREVLPIATVLFTFSQLLLALAVFVPALLWVSGGRLNWPAVLVVPVLLLHLLFALGIGFILALGTVFFRDVAHLTEVAVILLFWLTPIIYPFQLLTDELSGTGLPAWLPLINPVVPSIIAIQRGVYGTPTVTRSDGTVQQLLPDLSQWWYLRNILFAFVAASLLLALAIKIFDRAEANFAEVI